MDFKDGKMPTDAYKWLLTDTVAEMIRLTQDDSLYEDTPVQHGYLLGLYAMLHLIETQADAFLIPRGDIGLGNFSADEWLRLGKSYWSSR